MSEYIEGDWADCYQLVKEVDVIDIRYTPPGSRGRMAYHYDRTPIQMWIGGDKATYRAFGYTQWKDFVDYVNQADKELNEVIDELDKARLNEMERI